MDKEFAVHADGLHQAVDLMSHDFGTLKQAKGSGLTISIAFCYFATLSCSLQRR